ncbi:MAG: (d)CMP kinase [Firmicutes bacterium]|nr:(d)CMP kinase [Bacillota bacterium]
MQIIHIAIDGPAAAGKGSVALGLSKALGIPCLDTGAIYRAIALFAYRNGIDNFVGKLGEANISAKIINNSTHVFIGKEDVTKSIRENEVSQTASKVATMKPVRDYATKMSKDLAKGQSLIAEGRDICSVVLDKAKYKFYLTADNETRARRRHAELTEKGKQIPYEQVLEEIIERDTRDKTKGGLVQVPDAVVVDSTKMTVDQVIEHMLKHVHGK